MANNGILSRAKPDIMLFAPLLCLLVSSFFLGTAAHRIVFYALSPVLGLGLWAYRDVAIRIIQTPLAVCIALYLGYFSLTALWSAHVGLYSTFRMGVDVVSISLFIMALSVWFFVAPYRPHLLRILVGGVLAVGLMYAAFFYGVSGNELQQRFWGYGRYANPIHLSALFAITIFIWVLIQAHIQNKRHFLLGLGVVMALIALVFLTHTRSTLLAMGAGFVVVGLLRGPRIAAGISGVMAMCAIAAYFLWGESFAALLERGDTHRLAIWKEAWGSILQRPFFGYGILYDPHFLSVTHPGGFKATHNVLLGHALHGGVVGLALFLVVVCCCAITATRSYLIGVSEKMQAISSLALVWICFSAVFSQFEFAHYIEGVRMQWMIFWVPVSLCLCLEAAYPHK